MSSKAAQIRISLLGAAKAVVESEKIQKALRGVREETNQLERAGKRLGAVRDGLTDLIAPVAKLSIIGTLPAAAGAAAAGFGAVSASLGPVVGAAAPAAAGMLAFHTSMGLAKASALGLDKSFEGVFDDFQNATPATERLAETVRGLVPDLLSLKNSVQSRVLGGLNDGIKGATPLLAAVRPQILATSDVLGGLASAAGHMMGGSFFTGAASRILQTNVGVIRNVGGAGLHTAMALTRVLDAARPLTAWVGRLAYRFGAYLNVATNAGERSGKLADFFDKTRVVLSRLGRILGDVGAGLFNILRQGAPLGDSLMVSIVRGADAFREWTESASGKNAIGQWFATARPIIEQVAGMIGDVALAFGRIGLATAPTVAPMLAELRTLLPVIEQVVTATTQAFGPAVVGLIVALASALQPIAGSSGPLLLLVQGLTLLAKGFTWVVQTVPGMSSALSMLAGSYAVVRALTLGSTVATVLMGAATTAAGMVMGVYRTAVLLPLIIAVARYRAALIAQSVATRGAALAQGALNIAMRMNPIGLIITALVAVAAGFVMAYRKIAWFRNGVNAVWTWLKTNWPLVLSILTGPIGAAVIYIVRHWDQIKTAASSVVGWVKSRFTSLVSFITTLPGKIASAASGLFNGVKDAFRGALNWIIARWNGFELSLGPVKLPGPVPDIPKLAIGTPDIPRFATGGPVMGGAPYTDRVLGLLKPGEHVIPREEVRAAGGHRAIAGIRNSLRAPGASLPEGRRLTVGGEDGSGLVLEATIHSHLHVDRRELGESVEKHRVQIGARD
jgi:phage-related protein